METKAAEIESSFLEVIVRPAKREDCDGIMKLKKELALHQDMGSLAMLSVEELQRDGFDVSPPCYHCIVAEMINDSDEALQEKSKDSKGNPGSIVGYALYFYGFAVWEGKVLHLEDLCVSSEVRGRKIGEKLMKKLAKIAIEENCARIQLEVLSWNEVALKFYNKLGGWNTTQVEGWHNFRLGNEAMKKLIEKHG